MGIRTKENKAYWKARALFYEQQYEVLKDKYRLLLDQNKLLWDKDMERKKEETAKRTFMDKVESAYSEYQIAFASEGKEAEKDVEERSE